MENDILSIYPAKQPDKDRKEKLRKRIENDCQNAIKHYKQDILDKKAREKDAILSAEIQKKKDYISSIVKGEGKYKINYSNLSPHAENNYLNSAILISLLDNLYSNTYNKYYFKPKDESINLYDLVSGGKYKNSDGNRIALAELFDHLNEYEKIKFAFFAGNIIKTDFCELKFVKGSKKTNQPHKLHISKDFAFEYENSISDAAVYNLGDYTNAVEVVNDICKEYNHFECVPNQPKKPCASMSK